MANNGYADLVIRGGNVITVDPLNPRAQAVAVKFGRILAVGRNDEMEPLIGRDTRVTDVAGKTVIPGLIDAHCHGMSAGRSALQIDCGPDAVSSIAETKKAIMERCKATPKGEWICGFSYDDTKLAEKRLLKRADIDEVAPEHRELDGTVYETAQEMFTRGTDPIIPPLKPEQDREAIKLMCSRATSIGITSAAEAIVDPIMFRALQAALGGGELTMRIYMLFHVDYLDDLIGAGLRTGFGDDWLRLGAIKILGDGAIAGRTAYLSEPYVGTEDDYGIIATPPEKLDEELMTAHKAGFQIAVHANGDKYIGMTLDAYEKAIQAYPREDHRHRIEHCTVLNPELLSRIKRLGIVAVPFGSYIYYHGEKMGFYGEKRLSMMFAHRSLLDAGVPVGGSSDHTCAPWFPLAGIQSCVTRKSYTGEVLGPEQRISPEEALWVYTMGSAYASFEENTKGSIEEGKLADMVVLEEDLTNVEPEQIKDIPIMATMVGGRFVYNPMSLPG
jgi:predicted amidohydrolase YtcJ